MNTSLERAISDAMADIFCQYIFFTKINFDGGDLSSDELIHDPVLTAILDKKALTSLPALSRFFNRMDETTLNQFNVLMRRFRKVVYAIKKPKLLLLDLDSTLLYTYGHQKGKGFNFHYRSHGHHPLVCYDGMTGDLLKIKLRNDTDYSSTGVVEFLYQAGTWKYPRFISALPIFYFICIYIIFFSKILLITYSITN